MVQSADVLGRRKYAWQRAPHHRIITDALTDVFEGRIKRLIINIPPRYSKTELIKAFMAWGLGRAPDSEWIYTSYSARLAAASSFDVRTTVSSAEYKAVFPKIKLRDDSQAKDEWRTTEGGLVYATGAGGTITGYGAGKYREGFGGAFLIDDPLKADEARSDVMRQNVIDWYQNTVQSRMNSPQTPVILVMQRLHESDLSGWLLEGGTGEVWNHICLPAIRDDGSALWPEKHSIEELRRMEAAMPYTFAGQYQQRPAPAEGGLFKPDRMQIIDELPFGPVQWCRAWDLGSTTGGDWTAGGLIGRLSDGRFVIADMRRMRCGPDERDAAMLATAHQDGRPVKVSIPQDPGQAGKTQAIYMAREFAGFNIHASPETGDKVTRAEPLAAQINVGNVLMLRGNWNAALLDEMRSFPNGAHDDQIDALSRAFANFVQPQGLAFA